jgi:uncharacterized protein (DUF3084 family)
MRSLTFLDYTPIEATGKNIEAQLIERGKQIQRLEQEMNELNKNQEKLEKRLQIICPLNLSDKF